eukprot:CAMPEP_0172649868 /NCGR_PEP_ID=MMETSP1068-20121228/242009_1 /TAXON_ID=35684 /ORGANISM="Pseudopedinella elastica, Strain CCMP716" /LENGTH=55 /DNA_ID=CAMNT_0013464229 /DNA_START=558 /DNA_END=722 /DNA_ORIENTATION=+
MGPRLASQAAAASASLDPGPGEKVGPPAVAAMPLGRPHHRGASKCSWGAEICTDW